MLADIGSGALRAAFFLALWGGGAAAVRGWEGDEAAARSDEQLVRGRGLSLTPWRRGR